jgi:hypothetical protein
LFLVQSKDLRLRHLPLFALPVAGAQLLLVDLAVAPAARTAMRFSKLKSQPGMTGVGCDFFGFFFFCFFMMDQTPT